MSVFEKSVQVALSPLVHLLGLEDPLIISQARKERQASDDMSVDKTTTEIVKNNLCSFESKQRPLRYVSVSKDHTYPPKKRAKDSYERDVPEGIFPV
ncbi:hypothetical protein SARC_15771 [Sphaeroforma arctica JP610]|uniref:Uncharacterized protein n=1 Tax=Sphaeroforma arctica JP610 TaxID=667725 RepID=A0A0L0F516_9EUKA|nr:hypothetical protein SARC_15771 [Sphaeroforma arctica JP610]KNC71689.1 hypothetical protein SARC_15771 [Sphaeroforma arctica JP610]|eukprot:XP_014145591.1 hypothetical protein SARC_15771 [Sphaeroforma arctica JP610]